MRVSLAAFAKANRDGVQVAKPLYLARLKGVVSEIDDTPVGAVTTKIIPNVNKDTLRG